MNGTMRWLVPFVFCLISGCNNAPADMREWRATDHDHVTNPGSDQVQGGPDAGVSPELAKHGLNEVTIASWQQNCVRCHGRLGRGDGPQGPMLRATDLTDPRWQAAVSDEQMMKSIREGKGSMPAFDLPESTLRPLVALIRLFARAHGPAPADSGVPSASAGASAVPPARPSPSGTARAPAAPAMSGISAPRTPAPVTSP